jgi:hypothetical protein
MSVDVAAGRVIYDLREGREGCDGDDGGEARLVGQGLEEDGSPERNTDSAELARRFPSIPEEATGLVKNGAEIALFGVTEGAVFPVAFAVATGVVDEAAVIGGDKTLGHSEHVLFFAAASMEEEGGAAWCLGRSVKRDSEE